MATQRTPIKSIAFKLDADGDTIMRDDGSGFLDLELILDDEEAVQSLRNILLTRLGEDILHPDIGLPFQTIAAVGGQSYVAGAVARALLTDDRVASVPSVTAEFASASDRAERALTVQARAVLKDGTSVTLETALG